MIRTGAFVLAAAALLAGAFVGPAHAGHPHTGPSFHGMTKSDVWAAYMASRTSWHGQYYHTNWNRPVALVVPPTANNQTSWGWGVGGTRVNPIYPQFGRANHYGGGPSGPGFPMYPTPIWPSDTEQFGVYYVRGPW